MNKRIRYALLSLSLALLLPAGCDPASAPAPGSEQEAEQPANPAPSDSDDTDKDPNPSEGNDTPDADTDSDSANTPAKDTGEADKDLDNPADTDSAGLADDSQSQDKPSGTALDVSTLSMMEKALDSLMLCSLERDLEYDCENATFFWYSIYYGVINHTSEIPLAEPIEEDIRVPKMAVQEFASGLFRDYSDLPAIPKELSLVRYDENWDAYVFTPMPRGEIATRLLSASSFADGTIEAAAVLYNTQNDQPLFCGTFLLEENPYADGVTDAMFPYRIAEMKRSDAVNTPEELPACKGTYEGFSDNHTVEFKIDGNLMAFQVEDPQGHALLALLSEGSEISFVATTDAHTEVRTIVSILGE